MLLHNHLLLNKPCLLPPSTSSKILTLNHPNSFLAINLNPISRIISHNNGSVPLSQENSSTANEDNRADHSVKLKRKIEALGVNADSCTPGLYDLLYCPMCKGGRVTQRSLSFHISQNWSYALWRCFDIQCGWTGKVVADAKKANLGVNLHGQVSSSRELTVEGLNLEVLGDELLAYFAERMITEETLKRNHVMQVAGDQKIIAFTYRQNGVIVGCKYRRVGKRYWQEKNTEKFLYGLDDIPEADEIIIVEGETDKLSMEEAGYYNCVSVPSGAPQMVSIKELPPLEKDTSFPYLWNCRDYLDKASRIILATDGDIPGQALAEELSRRLGRERCWQVKWPKKDEFSSFKDANEVLKNLGADAIREAIDSAELYDVPSLN